MYDAPRTLDQAKRSAAIAFWSALEVAAPVERQSSKRCITSARRRFRIVVTANRHRQARGDTNAHPSGQRQRRCCSVAVACWERTAARASAGAQTRLNDDAPSYMRSSGTMLCLAAMLKKETGVGGGWEKCLPKVVGDQKSGDLRLPEFGAVRKTE